MASYIPVGLAIALPVAGGVAGSIVTRNEIKTWYTGLKKPWFTPPNWVFGPMWTSLYTCMGYASYLVWRDGGGLSLNPISPAVVPLSLYAAQLGLNFAWSPLFFGKHKIRSAFVDIVAMWAGIAACIVTFRPINETASNLMIPYLGWVTLATALNHQIIALNPNEESSKRD
eukprot:Opistho-2@33469